MKVDAQMLFSDAQAITADAASTNQIDLGIARNLGDGEPMVVCMIVDVAADFTTTDEAYEFQVETDGDVAFGSPTDVVVTTIAASALTAASKHFFHIPVGFAIERYLRMYFNVGGTTPTITVTAFLIPQSMAQKDKVYAKGYTIS